MQNRGRGVLGEGALAWISSGLLVSTGWPRAATRHSGCSRCPRRAPVSMRRGSRAIKKRFHNRHEFCGLLYRWDVAALIKAHQVCPRDSCRVSFAGSNGQQGILFSPNHQRRHMNLCQSVVKPLGSQTRIAQDGVNRVAVVLCEFVGKAFLQNLVCDPACVVKNCFQQFPHIRQRARIQVWNRLVLLQSRCVHEHKFFDGNQVRATGNLRRVQGGDPPAQRFAHEASLLHLQRAQKLVQKIHIRLDLIVNQRLVRTAKANLVHSDDAILFRERRYHPAPVSILAAPQAMHQNEHRPRAYVPIMNRLAENKDGLVLRLLRGSLPEARGSKKCEGNYKKYLQTRLHGSSASCGLPCSTSLASHQQANFTFARLRRLWYSASTYHNGN